MLDAGAPLAAAQARFAEADQMLALDPPLGAGQRGDDRRRRRDRRLGPACATATGPPRDLVVGMTMALADGTVARGGRQGDQERRGL